MKRVSWGLFSVLWRNSEWRSHGKKLSLRCGVNWSIIKVSWRASTFLMYLRVAAVHPEVGIKSTGFRVTTNNSSCSLLKYHIFSIIEINLHAYSNGKWNQSQIYTCMYQSWTLFIYLLRKIQCIFFPFLQKFNWILY